MQSRLLFAALFAALIGGLFSSRDEMTRQAVSIAALILGALLYTNDVRAKDLERRDGFDKAYVDSAVTLLANVPVTENRWYSLEFWKIRNSEEQMKQNRFQRLAQLFIMPDFSQIAFYLGPMLALLRLRKFTRH